MSLFSDPTKSAGTSTNKTACVQIYSGVTRAVGLINCCLKCGNQTGNYIVKRLSNDQKLKTLAGIKLKT